MLEKTPKYLIEYERGRKSSGNVYGLHHIDIWKDVI